MIRLRSNCGMSSAELVMTPFFVAVISLLTRSAYTQNIWPVAISYSPDQLPPVVRFHILVAAKEFHAALRATEPFIGSVSTTSLACVDRPALCICSCSCRYLYLNLGQYLLDLLP